MAIAAAIRGKINNYRRWVLTGVPLLIIVIVAGALIYNYLPRGTKAEQAARETKRANEAFVKGDKKKALEHAKKALADQPDNITNIQMVANLIGTDDPGAAKQYYAQALDKYKQQNNLGGAHTTAVNYWVAARFAQLAGKNSQAIQYYQQVIKTADPSSSYEQGLAAQAPLEIKDLQ